MDPNILSGNSVPSSTSPSRSSPRPATNAFSPYNVMSTPNSMSLPALSNTPPMSSSSILPTFNGTSPIPFYPNFNQFLRGPSFLHSSSRSMHASNVERILLLKVMIEYLPSLESRDTDARTAHRRTSIWAEITNKFNERTSTQRSRHQVQTLYKNMKAKAKKYQARLADPNGPMVEQDQVSETLLAMLSQEYMQRNHSLHQAAILTFRDDSPTDVVKEESLSSPEEESNDVSRYLEQELHVPAESNSSNNISTPTLPISSSVSVTPLSSLKKLPNSPPASSSSDPDSSFSPNEIKSEPMPENSSSSTSNSDQNISPLRPETVRMQEILYAKSIAATSSQSDTHVQNSPQVQTKKTNHLSTDAQLNPRNISTEAKTTIGEVKRHNSCEQHPGAKDSSSNSRLSHQILTNSSSSTEVCCNSLHDAMFEMRKREHELNMQILKEKLQGERVELEMRRKDNEMRESEHKMRINLLRRQSRSFKRSSLIIHQMKGTSDLF